MAPATSLKRKRSETSRQLSLDQPPTSKPRLSPSTPPHVNINTNYNHDPPNLYPQPERFRNKGGKFTRRPGKTVKKKDVVRSVQSGGNQKEKKQEGPPEELRGPKDTHDASKFFTEEEWKVIKKSMPSLETGLKVRRAESAVSGSASGGAASKPNNANSNSTTKSKSKQKVAKPKGEDRIKELERNIDSVIFGELVFTAWYPSWYPKEIIGEKALDGKGMGITVKELFVCKKCFGYSKEVLEWVRHCRCCEKEVPGERVYVHGGKHGEEREGQEGKGGWSIYEVDGEKDTLFCQNLSLFAKLFLDNKSVFFDVAQFKYFLLVHTNPANPSSPDQVPGEQQIVGFFSKEKNSWDNNNLACILVFPPWQRKGLGSLLMGISYAIAKRECIMGGPEKPISELGRKGYKRYWGTEIARWLLECKETDKKKGKGMVDVEAISKDTWISQEDCLAVLREMGIMEKAGRGKGEVERVRVDKRVVREWCERGRIRLDRVVDEEGFVEGYALREGDGDAIEVEMDG